MPRARPSARATASSYRAITTPRYRLEQINEAFANADQGNAIRTALICAPDLVRG